MLLPASAGAHIAELTEIVNQSRQLVIALAGLSSLGLTGFALAARKALMHLRGMDTTHLNDRVDHVVRRLDGDAERLDRIESRLDTMQDDVSAMRGMLDRVLAKLAQL